MAEQLDLFGNPVNNPVKKKRVPAMPSFCSYCFACGRRIPEGREIPVAFHTDYCQACYEAAMAAQK